MRPALSFEFFLENGVDERSLIYFELCFQFYVLCFPLPEIWRQKVKIRAPRPSNFELKMISMNCAAFLLNYASNSTFSASRLPKIGSHKVLEPVPSISNFSPKMVPVNCARFVLSILRFVLHPSSKYETTTLMWEPLNISFSIKMMWNSRKHLKLLCKTPGEWCFIFNVLFFTPFGSIEL